MQGENIYSGYFPFVRELLQNAIDSTKLQCYEDYKTSSKFRFQGNPTSQGNPGISSISKIVNPVEYPIEISISCCRLNEDNNYEEISLDDIPETEGEKEKYGILFSIKDYGTGISAETLRNISDVGTSYKRRKKLLREIPDWLRPTGEFGIGLQSVFLVSDNFFCETYVRNGERFKIEFLTGANGKNGYINVEPEDPEEKPMAYGSEFQVFIGHEKKKDRRDYMDAWTGHDPFAAEYESSQIRRDIIALTIQLLLDIDSQLEDLLFPIYVSVKFELLKEQRDLLKSKMSKIVFNNWEAEGVTEENLKRNMCWIYQNTDGKLDDGNIIGFEIEQGVCRVDLTQMKIYLWLEDLAVSVCLGVDFVASDSFQSIQSPCRLYYKGILVDTHNINQSGNLLEYINIQGGRGGRKLIQLSRNGFTQEGLAYIDSKLIPRIYRNLFDVLKTLANQRFDSGDMLKQLTFSEKIKENIERNLEAALDNKGSAFEKAWQKQLVGTSLYYNFYMSEIEKKNAVYLSRQEEYEREQWGEAVCYVSEVISRRRNETIDIYSKLAVTEVYVDFPQNTFTVLGKKEITIADFYRKENKFAVVSKRRDTGDKWINSLIWLKNPEEMEEKEESEERGERVPPLIELLETPASERNRRKGWAGNLEEWADFMLENVSAILESQSIQQSNFVLALLQSVSISACFIDSTGNYKIHILSGKPLGSVYYNSHAKYKLLKRMEKRKYTTNAERFAGSVWMGYELLQLSAISEDICNIKEQYVQESDAFMIYPCSGIAVRKLIRFAETSEEKYWSEKQQEESTQGEMATCLTEMEVTLRKIAESLYSCIVIEYAHVKDVCEEYFIEKYVDYCRKERVRTSEVSFWDFLNSGYTLMLGTMLQDEFRKRTGSEKHGSWRDLSITSLTADDMDKLFNEHLPKEDIDTVDTLKGVIGISILENSEAIFDGKELSGSLLDDMNTLKDYCYEWEWLWNLVEHLRMELEAQAIKRYLLESSVENANLVSWVTLQTRSEQQSVAECYDRMWNELIGAVLRRKESNTEEQHFKLLDWMRKKERTWRSDGNDRNGTV